MSNKSGTSDQVISLPQGGGALQGIGETFSPDLHTGTGNFTVPIALPPGRNGFQPQLNLVYSTGNGNGPYGLGWSLSIPGVSRKTAKGNPRYQDGAPDLQDRDTFILSGAEDLVPVTDPDPSGIILYRPRTEGLFARIEHHQDAGNDYWEVRSQDGLVSFYGTPAQRATDPATVADPNNRRKVYSWMLSRTEDPFGNHVVYDYRRDQAQDGPHDGDQLYLEQIRYVDYEKDGATSYLVSVTFHYEDRPDPFSSYRSGFEIRTTRRCRAIEVRTHADGEQLVRRYHLVYLDQRDDLANLDEQLPLNGASLLSRIQVEGIDESQPAGQQIEALPPLEFGYTRFDLDGRDFFPVAGMDIPAHSLASPDLELADLFGNGLPDILEMNGTVRYWRNLGANKFDLPRPMRDAPAGLSLADPDVQLIDADGDGRIDLLVTGNGLSGYFPLRFNGEWDRRSFQRYKMVPSFNLDDPEVKLVDLDGDGVTDAIRSGSRLECFFNDPQQGWNETRQVERQGIDRFPNINFSDPRVKWGDMSGDGLQDIVLVYDGCVEYWPALGYGNWARPIYMGNSPRFPYGYDPKRILVGDVDGDGLADLVYVDDTEVTLWMNRSGNGWSDPIEIQGTPPVTDMDAVRLVDMLGSGISGLLWSADADGLSYQRLFFLDFTGGVKPYLLNEMDNHMGALTRVAYAPSTRFYLEDQQRPETRWQTPLPFPVQVVARVEVIDHLSRGKLATEYRYHHGYWDGAEREFRGFGMVEQLDTETFATYHAPGLAGVETGFNQIEAVHFSPPTLTKNWFHQGPAGDEFGEWVEMDYSAEFWPGDPPALSRPQEMSDFLKALPRRLKRDALRTLRGNLLRSELYALDGTECQDRPYTVTESLPGVASLPVGEAWPEKPETWRQKIFFPHTLAQRTTQWERGDEPMTQFTFTGDYDEYGQPRSQISIAVPRGRDFHASAAPGQPYLATRTMTDYVHRDDAQRYLIGRVARATTYEILNDGSPALFALRQAIEQGTAAPRIIGQALNFYDGDAFTGLPFGQVGDYGALVRSESLVLTQELLHDAYRSGNVVLTPAEEPPYLAPGGPAWTEEYPPAFRDLLPPLAGYLFYEGDDPHERGYFVTAGRQRYDFQTPGAASRGLVLTTRDPLGHETLNDYDTFDLLPESVTDPAGLTTTAAYDYRVMQPRQITDANGNRSAFAFTPLGLLSSSAVMGKPGEGDTPTAPGVRLVYDFLAFENSPPEDRQPISVRTIQRVHHVNETDIPLPGRDESIEKVEYSDGFGRLLQARAQAEDVTFGDPVFGGSVLPAGQNDANTTKDVVGQKNTELEEPTVVVSGWQIYDNKGQVVEKYEPFFASGWAYAPPVDDQLGQKATTFYDPRGQVIRTLNPDGSEQRVIYGVPADLANPEQFAPTAWEAFTYDANDNAGRTHPEAAPGYQQHWNTPASIVIDALGRAIEAVERNGPVPATDWYTTRSTYDIQGNLLTVSDALGRVAFKHIYDLAQNPLRIESIDAGLRRIVLDALGNPVEGRDGKGALALHAYDILNRPIRLWARDDAGSAISLRQRLEYGDGSSPDQPGAERQANRQANRLGKLHKYYDEAGLLTFELYDFKGNVREKVRQVIGDAAILAVFDPPPPNWQAPAFRVDWQPPDAVKQLDPAEYRTSLTYDALNRVKTMRYPGDVASERKELRPYYNRAGSLERVTLDDATYVERIVYNAKGQRSLIAYGNGVMTRHGYDPHTFRLVRLRSERYTKPNELAYHPAGAPLQDFAYDYDLVGNILHITDRTPGSGVLNNPESLQTADPQLAQLLVAGDALIRHFKYDPLYRLLSGSGRECKDIPMPRPWADDPRCGFNSGNHGTPNQDNAAHLTARYQEDYAYDPAGNLLTLHHSANSASWTRHFGMGGLAPQQWSQEWPNHVDATEEWLNPPGNRLTHAGDDQPGVPQSHFYDDNGNLVRETTSRHFEWDYADQMRVYRAQPGNAEPSVHAHYLYDAGGQRVKKLVRKQGGQFEVMIYIDGLFEHHRLTHLGSVQENNTLHIMDDQSRIALVRVGAPFPNDSTPAVKFHLADHLGSSNVVVGNDGNWINREEYMPYGETSFGSFARKRYRFTGKERDEESGLYYHGARYYAAWLGRWTSTDPAGMADHMNAYVYCRNSPLCRVDSYGANSEEVDNIKADLYDAAYQEHGFPGEYEKADIASGVAESKVKRAENMVDFLHDEYRAGKFTEEQYQRKLHQQKHNLNQAKRNLAAAEQRLNDVKVRWDAARAKLIELRTKAIKLGISSNEIDDLEVLARGNAAGLNFGDPPKRPIGKSVSGPGSAKPGGWWKKTVGFGKKVLGSKVAKVIFKATKMIPLVGIVPGAISMVMSAAEGEYEEAVLDAIGFIPIIGDALDLLRLVAEFVPERPLEKPVVPTPAPAPRVAPPSAPPPPSGPPPAARPTILPPGTPAS